MSDILKYFRHRKKLLLTLILSLMFLWSLTSVSWNKDLIHIGGLDMLYKILASIFSPEINSEIIWLSIKSAWITLTYAVCGISISVLIALVFGVLASGILSKAGSKSSVAVFFRVLLGLMRSIHELVWAWLFVASIGLTPFAAIFALSIPYSGILGRIYADKFKDIDHKPITALKSSGASSIEILFYGYLPMTLLDLVSYSMYRLECAIRSSTVMSFVGLGGLGYQIQLSLDDLNYNRVWTILFFLILLVILVDVWSSTLRRELVRR